MNAAIREDLSSARTIPRREDRMGARALERVCIILFVSAWEGKISGELKTWEIVFVTLRSLRDFLPF